MKFRMIALLAVICLLILPTGCKESTEDSRTEPVIGNAADTPTYQPVDPSQLLSPEEAGAIALKDADLSDADVVGMHSAYGIEDGRQTIAVTFREGHIQYEYVLDAVSGEILFAEKDN